MKIALIAAACVVALILLVLLIGSRLPRHHEVSRSAVVAGTPSEIYAAVTDFEHAPAWRKDVKRVEILERHPSRVLFREHGAHGAVTYEAASFEPARRFVTTILDRDLGYSGSWTYELAPEGGGTRVTITERGDVSNVFFRFMARFVFGQAKTIETYLTQLGARR